MKQRAFTAPIQDAGGGGCYVDIPFDVEQEYGRKRVPIVATIDGEEYRGTLVRMGKPCHMLVIRKDIRTKLGKGPGDTVRITLREDTDARTVSVPEDLAAALAAEPQAAAFFDQLSYTHRKEYVQWIEEAKKPETRSNRVRKAIELLLAGRKER